MPTPELTYTNITANEAPGLWETISQALHRSIQPGWNEHVGHERFRAVRMGSEIVGGMGIIPMGQWFGGRLVPAGAVTSVGVAPEGRGIGAASVLMHGALREMQASGMVISTLFPSSARVYRSFGYERSGVKLTYEAPVKEMRTLSNELSMTEAREVDREEMVLLFNKRGSIGNGNLDRGDVLWDLILGTRGRQVFTYIVKDGAEPVGYVNFQQARSADHIRVRDMVALTPEAAQRLLRFFSDHRTVIETISWNGPPNDPLMLMMEEQEAKQIQSRDWMVRILNVKSALEARGYPAAVEISLALTIEDPLLDENTGTWTLDVSGGRGTVTSGGTGGLSMGPRGFAPLYTNHLSPPDIKNIGLLKGTDEDLSKAAAIFSGPKPWIGNQF